MYNRIRIVNNISICFFIGACIKLINLLATIPSNLPSIRLSSAELISEIILIILRGLLPNIIGLVILTIIIITCNRLYKHKKDDLKIKNNYFFIGTYLLIFSIVSFTNIPFRLHWLLTVRELISYENMMSILIPDIVNVVTIILGIVIGIFMVLKDIRKKQMDIN